MGLSFRYLPANPQGKREVLRPGLASSSCPGVHIQSSQTVESSGLYTLKSVLSARLVKEDKDAQFYCELSYRLPSGNHMKESKEVTVPVLYPAEKVWVEVEPVGLLKEGDHVKIRCLTDGNPQPHFTINKKVQSPPCWVHGGA